MKTNRHCDEPLGCDIRMFFFSNALNFVDFGYDLLLMIKIIQISDEKEEKKISCRNFFF